LNFSVRYETYHTRILFLWKIRTYANVCYFSVRVSSSIGHRHHHHNHHSTWLAWCKRTALQEHVIKSVWRVLSLSENTGLSPIPLRRLVANLLRTC